MNKIINFHDITDGKWFEDTINILKRKYTFVSIEDISEHYYRKKKLNNSCHITIDDGDTTFYNVVYPILKRNNIPASIFVSPKIISERKNYWFQEIEGYDHENFKKIICKIINKNECILSKYPLIAILKCLKIDQVLKSIQLYQETYNIKVKESQNITLEQLIEIDRFGLVKIGAHTMNHPILANEDDKSSENEIAESLFGLRDLLGHEVQYFAYPNGVPGVDFSEREISSLYRNGCRIAFSSQNGDFFNDTDPLSINRYSLSHGGEGFVRAKFLLGEYWDILKESILKGEIRTRAEIVKKIHKEVKSVQLSVSQSD